MLDECFSQQLLKENGKDLKLLFIVEHAGTRLRFGNLFNKYFSEVKTISYAGYAIDKFKEEYFDLIITDLKLTDVDVVKLCYDIKRIAPKKHIIVILIKKMQIF